MSKDVKSVKIYSDNLLSLNLTENPELHQRTKHISVKYHYIQEEATRSVVRFWYCPTTHIKADGLTKPLSGPNQQKFVNQLGLQWVVPASDKEN